MWRKFRKDKRFRFVLTSVAVAASALLQAFVIQTFIRPAGLLTGGFTGVAILIDMIAGRLGGNFSTSLALVLLNLPVAFLCSKSISLRFTIFSLIQVLLTSVFLELFHFQPIFTDIVLNVIFGGALFGFSTVIALRGNASTGGTDFIALYVSNRTGNSIWGYVFCGNVALLCIFGLVFGWLYAGYSILFQFISTKMISAFHHRYERVTLQITTAKAPEILDAYVKTFRHGISCVDAIGGYSKKKMFLLHTVVSSYEVEDIIRLMYEIDDRLIVNLFRTEQFFGTFYRAPIE